MVSSLYQVRSPHPMLPNVYSNKSDFKFWGTVAALALSFDTLTMPMIVSNLMLPSREAKDKWLEPGYWNG